MQFSSQWILNRERVPRERLLTLLLGLRGATVLLAKGSVCESHGPETDERRVWCT